MLPVVLIMSLYYIFARTGLASGKSALSSIKRRHFGIFLADTTLGVWMGDTSYSIAEWTLSIELYASFFIYLIAFTVINYRWRFTIYIFICLFVYIP